MTIEDIRKLADLLESKSTTITTRRSVATGKELVIEGLTKENKEFILVVSKYKEDDKSTDLKTK